MTLLGVKLEPKLLLLKRLSLMLFQEDLQNLLTEIIVHIYMVL